MKKSVVTIIRFSFVLMLLGIPFVSIISANSAQDCDPRHLRIMVVIPETVINSRPPDPAAETEMIKRFIDAGFTVLDPIAYGQYRYSDEFLRAIQDAIRAQQIGRQYGVDVIIMGEGLGDVTTRDGQLMISRARVEARAVRVADATIIAADAVEGTARDLSGPIGAKAALRNAGGPLADDFIMRLARHYNLCPKPRTLARASTAVIRSTAPGLPAGIDLSTILSDALVQLKTVNVLVSGQDLEAILANAHAGTMPVPDVAIICSVEKSSIVNIGVVHRPLVVLYLNDVTLRMNVRAVDTETGLVLASTTKEETRRALDIVVSVPGITVGNFNRTILGVMVRDMLEMIAPEMAQAAIYAVPKATYFDIVTIRNGDRFGGAILNPNFTIVTSFGQFTIPTAGIQSLSIGESSRITRTDGSTFSGQILDPGLMVSNLGTIPMGQVATVIFAIR